MISSTIPSAKYSCFGSPLRFWNGKTAVDGLGGVRGGFRSLAQPIFGPNSDQTRIFGRATRGSGARGRHARDRVFADAQAASDRGIGEVLGI